MDDHNQAGAAVRDTAREEIARAADFPARTLDGCEPVAAGRVTPLPPTRLSRLYHVCLDGIPSGPHTYEDLRRMSTLVGSTPVWTDGLDAWAPAAEVTSLAGLLASTPPPVGGSFALRTWRLLLPRGADPDADPHWARQPTWASVQKLGAWVRLLNCGIAVYLVLLGLVFIDAFMGDSSRSHRTGFLGMDTESTAFVAISLGLLIATPIAYVLFTAVVVGVVRALRWPTWIAVLLGIAMNTSLWIPALVVVSVGSNRRLSRAGIRLSPLGSKVPDERPRGLEEKFGPALAVRAIIPAEKWALLRLLLLAIALTVTGIALSLLIGLAISSGGTTHV